MLDRYGGDGPGWWSVRSLAPSGLGMTTKGKRGFGMTTKGKRGFGMTTRRKRGLGMTRGQCGEGLESGKR